MNDKLIAITRKFNADASRDPMDYTYFATDWLPHQCFEFSPTPGASDTFDGSDHGPQTSAETARDPNSDLVTVQHQVPTLEQYDNTSIAFSQKFLNDLAFGSIEQYPILLQPQAEPPILASHPASTKTTGGSIFQPIAPNLTCCESTSRRSSTEEEITSPKKVRRKAQNRDA